MGMVSKQQTQLSILVYLNPCSSISNIHKCCFWCRFLIIQVIVVKCCTLRATVPVSAHFSFML